MKQETNLGNGWKDNHPKRAYQLCLLGLTNADLAIAFGVSLGTIEMWIRKHPRFTKAIRLGRQEADSKVAAALYKKATGYTYEEDIVNVSHGQVMVNTVKKFAHPETTAAIFWLKNRQADRWADVWKLDQNVNVNVNAVKHENLRELTSPELALLEKIGLRDFNLDN